MCVHLYIQMGPWISVLAISRCPGDSMYILGISFQELMTSGYCVPTIACCVYCECTEY